MATAVAKKKAGPVSIPVITVDSRESADAASLNLARVQRDLQALHAEMDAEVKEIEERYREEIAPLQSLEKAISAQITDWADASHDPEANGKTLKLTWSKIKWPKKSEKVLFRKGYTAEKIAANLRKFGLSKLIRKVETVQKTDLKEIDPKLHARLGFKIEPNDTTPSVEIDQKKIQTLEEFQS